MASFPIIYGLASQRHIAFLNTTVIPSSSSSSPAGSASAAPAPQDCSACRITGATTLGAVTAYLGYSFAHTPKAQVGNRVALASFAAVTGSLAVYRGLGL